MKRLASSMRFLFAMAAGMTAADAQDGFCMINGTTTGGQGGPTVTVTNGTDFITQTTMTEPRIVQVDGVLTIGAVTVKSDKTIIGLGTNATLLGRIRISGNTNIIVRNLRITNRGDDGISVRDPNTHHVWIDHVTFYDCGDGSCDISQSADYVTVSWCKFIYPTQVEHRFTMIADGPKDLGPLTAHITLHHNWWSTRSDQRMAATSDALVHYYNNYFNCPGNSYCSNARNEAELNSENNYYQGVKDPMTVSTGTTGKIKTSGNIYSSCTGTIYPGTDTVFTPPYAYTLDPTASVPVIVTAGAGAPGPDTVAIPPKVWDGSGTDNNLNTANNWELNEVPKPYDSLVFAGSTRLNPNNNFASATQFPDLTFSNNAGAFVLSGNSLNLGGSITDDSVATQTVNLNLSFTYGLDHYAMTREFNVSSPDGLLLIYGNISGPPNSYNKPYSVTKSGPGTLQLTGANNINGTFSFNGGLVQFDGLDNFQSITAFDFGGGGLRWAAGNTADISTRTVTIQSGGATLDSGANNIIFASAIGNNGSGGLTKTGMGKITLNGNNAYFGSTVIAQGTLALGLAGALPNSLSLILSNNAAFDVSGRGDGTLTLGSGKGLMGNGSVLGSVTADSGSTVAPGASIGTLAISGALNFQSGSTNVMELNAATHTNDLLTGMTSVNYGGTLMLANITGTMAAGESFQLFSASAYHNSFNKIVWPVLSPGLVWTNRLATDGSIAVVSIVNTTPTNITSVVVGGDLQLSWPADHIGWHLEAQTNGLSDGLGTNWVPVPNSQETNWFSLPIDSTNGSVFLRLAYP